jgi:acetyltransferase-like isoleucine patch superfamily enzyme
MRIPYNLIGINSRFYIWLLRRQGMKIAEDCRFSGRFSSLPHFGSEPYLISIGQHVAIASHVSFVTHDGGTWVIRHQERYKKIIKYGRITILDNCVIGRAAIILPGVTIGPNSVIAAGSVVTRSIPPNVIAMGNPAKPVMTIEQYAEWSLAGMPEYDEAEYARDKKACLLKMNLKGTQPSPKIPVAETASPDLP